MADPNDSPHSTFVQPRLNHRAIQALYRLSPPLDDGTEYVVVSGCVVMGEPEVYVFKSTETADITSWSEIDGSQRGTLDHEVALHDLGRPLRADE